MITRLVEDHAQALAGKGELPAFVYDLAALREDAAEVKAALSEPGAPEIFYAAKANPDAPILQALAPYVDGVEVASGGELAHVREALPDARLAFGGPARPTTNYGLPSTSVSSASTSKAPMSCPAWPTSLGRPAARSMSCYGSTSPATAAASRSP